LEDGTLVDEGVSQINPYGLWIYEVEVPSDATGRLMVEVYFDRDGSVHQIISLPIAAR